MARYNKIYGGPAEEVKPQVHEAICATSVLPGTAVVRTAGAFVAAVAASKGRMFVVQDNYLAMKGVDDAWLSGRPHHRHGTARRAALPGPCSDRYQHHAGCRADGERRVSKFIPAVAGNHVVAFANETYNNTSGADQLVSVRAAKGYTFA